MTAHNFTSFVKGSPTTIRAVCAAAALLALAVVGFYSMGTQTTRLSASVTDGSGSDYGQMSQEQKELIEAANHLRPPYDKDYGGYTGPWIEDYFFEYFTKAAHRPHQPLYLPLYWTNLQITGTDEQKAQWKEEVKQYMDRYVRGDREYFAVLQFKRGTAQLDLELPSNVHVFSAGGAVEQDFKYVRNVTLIPLIKDNLMPRNPPLPKTEENFVVTTINKTAAVRKKMVKALDEIRFPYRKYLGEEFKDVMESATFVLCPRGSGRTSWRVVETLQLGSIPIHIWDDVEVLPYNRVENFVWEQIGISINVDQIRRLPHILAGEPRRLIDDRLRQIRRLRKWFTLEGSAEYILRTIQGENVLF